MSLIASGLIVRILIINMYAVHATERTIDAQITSTLKAIKTRKG